MAMTTNNSLSSEIKKVMDSKAGKNAKRVALVKLGLNEIDASSLLWMYDREHKQEIAASKRAARERREARLAARLAAMGVDFDELIKSLTFGVEFECVNAPRHAVVHEANARGLVMNSMGYNHTNSQTAYKLVSDSSLRGADSVECVTPILNGAEGGFASMKACLESLRAAGAHVNGSCGTHVHVGYANMADTHYINVFANYQKLERLIDSFMHYSRINSTWCISMRGYDLSACTTKENVYHALGGVGTPHRDDSRYHKVNACSYWQHGTIEFRQHQGTLNYEKISMWVRFCLKLVVWSKDNRLSAEVTDINSVPFLNAEEKAFFTSRIQRFARCA